MDKTGLLWVATAEGLNCYDGYRVKKFYKEDYPQLQNNNILRMTCDNRNRLWIQFADQQVAMLDEQRHFHAISMPVPVDYLLPLTTRGVLFMHGSQLYTPHERDPLHIIRIRWQEDSLLTHHFERINIWDEKHLVFSGDSLLFLLNTESLSVTNTTRVPGIVAAVKLNDQEALVTTTNTNRLCKVNLVQNRITQTYGRTKDQFGQEMHMLPRSIYRLRGDEFVITSAFAGVYIFNPLTNHLRRYKHDVADNRSVSSDNTNFIFSDTSGYFFITSTGNGLNFFNIHHQLARWQPAFQDDRTGRIFDGFINCIAQSADGHLWLGTHQALIEWDRQQQTMRFHDYGQGNGTEEIKALCFDKQGRLWVGCLRSGIVLLGKNKKVIRQLNTLPNNMVTDIKQGPDGNMWVATMRGLYLIDPNTFAITPAKGIPFLERLKDKFSQSIWFRNAQEAWIGTTGAAYKVDLTTKTWQRVNVSDGLSNGNVLCFADDVAGNLYIGTRVGLNILCNGKVVKTYNRGNGLRSNRVDGLLRDDKGHIWIGNDNCLLRYDPQQQQFTAYDEGVGLSDAGFRPFAYYQANDGEFFWGSENGLSSFYPWQLRELRLPLQVAIHTVLTTDSLYWLPTGQPVTLPFSQNSISFAFSAIDLYGSRHISYRYMLEGVDLQWKTTQTLDEIGYSKLQPGNYRFRVMASRDGQDYTEAGAFRFSIATPWWRSGWFIVLATAIVITGLMYGWQLRTKKIRQQQEQIETEQAINYFASSIYEQTTIDNILWDIARNCIGRLNFEDCVIYLKQEDRDIMVQKAAWGPKTSGENKIINPIEIPYGKGIVGHVAASGVAEIVGDTSIDERYIVDDVRRYSEIAVPVVYNGNVLGIIDSEHGSRDFFTPKHLSILTAIASLCANKIMRVRAEDAMLQHQRKSVEAQLKSLRVQMNPHFLFNSLNAIQQMILTGEETAATLYLSKFSKLLRLVLMHSDKEKVTLKEELDTLSLYIELEALRFKESFQYQIICDDTVDIDETRIPTLLIQPFVENAIWHGLLHKEGARSLTIKFAEDNNDNLVCIVEDNGIGREAARYNHKSNTGKGIAVAEERLRTYNEQHAVKSQVLIQDLKDTRGLAAGTRVIVTLPLLN